MKIPKDTTPEQIGHIKELSKFVRQKENQAREVYLKLLDIQSELLEKRVFNIMIDISEKLMIRFVVDEESEDERIQSDFCVNKEWISTVFRTREDDEEEPSEVVVLDLEHLYTKDDVFYKNYNFFINKKEHPFYGLHFCRGMNGIINNNTLPFENILEIDNVWVDFEIEYSLINYHDSLLFITKTPQ